MRRILPVFLMANLLVPANLPAAGDPSVSSQPVSSHPVSNHRAGVKLTIAPHNPLLFGQGARQQLVAVVHFADGTERDVTLQVKFSSAKQSVAAVDSAGVIEARGNGGSAIRASYQGLTAAVTALVQKADRPLPVSFLGDVMPVFTRIGCNGGGCHGSLNGQNGFKLSLFGYEPDNDYEMITCIDEGRRLNPGEPEQSLLLTKPTFGIAHGGGQVLQKNSTEYEILLRWIRAGAGRDPNRDRKITSLRMTPASMVLHGKRAKRQILVTAEYANGSEADVTRWVKFQSNDDSIVEVTPEGVVTGLRGGETAIIAQGPGVITVAKIGVVMEKRRFPELEPYNFVDRHVFEKLRRLSLPPSGLAEDATFLRRAFVDIIGVIPAAEEVREFLSDNSSGKRARLVDDLLQRPEYADNWALYWGDHLGNTKQLLFNKGPYTFTRWLHKAFRENEHYDQFVRKLITSSGNMYSGDPAASFYPIMKKELDMASITSQLFLGVKIECARCHNHPLERWTQDDFSGMAAFFSQVRYKSGAGPRNNERILYVDFERPFKHPLTEKVYFPKALGGDVMVPDEWTDRRELLADWLTSRDNPYFGRAIVNRMWANFMGRGIVDPVDDIRVTNPPTNEPLLAALAADFIEHDYDLHHLIRVITSSKVYQLSAVATDENIDDTVAYSRYYPRRMTAEQLSDSIAKATGVPEEFRYLYPGTRASQLPEPEIPSYFLDVFDRPSRQQICERTRTSTLNQALHLISGDTVQKKIVHADGVLERMLREGKTTEEITEELYLRTLSRYPDAEERRTVLTAVERSGERRRGIEDAFWALLNSKEFLYNH